MTSSVFSRRLSYEGPYKVFSLLFSCENSGRRRLLLMPVDPLPAPVSAHMARSFTLITPSPARSSRISRPKPIVPCPEFICPLCTLPPTIFYARVASFLTCSLVHTEVKMSCGGVAQARSFSRIQFLPLAGTPACGSPDGSIQNSVETFDRPFQYECNALPLTLLGYLLRVHRGLRRSEIHVPNRPEATHQR